MSKNKHRNNQYNPNMNRNIPTENSNVVDDVEDIDETDVEDVVEDDVVVEVVDTAVEVVDPIEPVEIIDPIVESEIVETDNVIIDIAVESVETVAEPIVETPQFNADYTQTKVANGFCIGTSFDNAENVIKDYNQACKIADEQTKLTGEVNHVYNMSGEIIFSSKKKLAIISKIHEKRGMRRC